MYIYIYIKNKNSLTPKYNKVPIFLKILKGPSRFSKIYKIKDKNL